MRRLRDRFLLIIIVVFGLAIPAVAFQNINIDFLGVSLHRDGFQLGLDLRGGSHLVFEAEPENTSDEQMEGVVSVIRNRIDNFGVTEPVIQRQGDRRVVVQLPGVTDAEDARVLIGQTARLEFKERICLTAECGPDQREDREIGLTGENLTSAFVNTNQTLGFPQINLQFDSEGARIFGEVTSRVAATAATASPDQVAIFLDDTELVSPTADQPILSGSAVIFRRVPPFTLEEAQRIAIQLEAGRLPVPLTFVSGRTVDATLGADALEKSEVAGLAGAALVALFMILYYRVPGLLASVALALYIVLVLALFKLIPVTLTLAGVAAFVLSVGMAVDANVLIFERLREELRTGRTMGAAVEAGFNRAWPAIRDSNLSTFIICAVLWWFGDRLGASLVQGFAVTLFIGVAASMFTAIVVVRTLLRFMAMTPFSDRLALFIPAQPQPGGRRERRALQGRE